MNYSLSSRDTAYVQTTVVVPSSVHLLVAVSRSIETKLPRSKYFAPKKSSSPKNRRERNSSRALPARRLEEDDEVRNLNYRHRSRESSVATDFIGARFPTRCTAKLTRTNVIEREETDARVHLERSLARARADRVTRTPSLSARLSFAPR